MSVMAVKNQRIWFCTMGFPRIAGIYSTTLWQPSCCGDRVRSALLFFNFSSSGLENSVSVYGNL
jgi:hypothetical protein